MNFYFSTDFRFFSLSLSLFLSFAPSLFPSDENKCPFEVTLSKSRSLSLPPPL